MSRKVGADDFLRDTGAPAEHVEGLPRVAIDPRPVIAVRDLDLRPLRADLWGLLRQANAPPVLFTSGVRLARVRPIPDSGRIILDEHTLASFQACLADVARFDGGNTRPRLVAPPPPLVAAMLTEVSPPVPVLTRVVPAPVIAPDGTVLTTPGYHPATRTYYAPARDLTIGALPAHPTETEIAWARTRYLEIVRDFPFATESDRTHALAAGLLPFGRDLIDGPTPIHLYEAPTWGSGKTLLATAVFFPFLGELDSVQPEPESSAEWRKRLTSLLREGTAVAIIDNALDELTAGPLMSFVTSLSYRDRLLGKTATGHYVNRLVLAITGNNPVLSGEALRRAVRIRLVPAVPHPWLRDPSTFTHSDLASWLRQERATLVRAALILWRAWIAADRPGPSVATPAFGKFEAWRHVMGGLCARGGLAGFLANQRAFYEETTTTDEATGTFVLEWWAAHGASLVVPVPTLFQLAQQAGLSFDARTQQGEVVRFGKWLVRLRDRLFTVSDTLWVRVVRTDSSHGGVHRWRLTPVDPPSASPSPDDPGWLHEPAPPPEPGGERHDW